MKRRLVEWVALTAVCLVLWETGVRVGFFGSTAVAAPTAVARSMVELAQDSDVRGDFFTVIWYILVAFVLGSLAGILLGFVLGTSHYLYRVFYPFLLIWFSTPTLIFIPLLILLFGVGAELKIAYGILAAIPSVAVTVAAGVQMTDDRLVHAARSLGARRLRISGSVVLPGTVPSVMTSLRYALNHVLLGVIIAELFASSAGLGLTIKLYSATLRADHVYALLFSLAIASVMLAFALARVERYVMRWQGVRDAKLGVG